MTSLVNKLADWPPNYNKILIFSPPKSLKRLRAGRIDELADSNKPGMTERGPCTSLTTLLDPPLVSLNDVTSLMVVSRARAWCGFAWVREIM